MPQTAGRSVTDAGLKVEGARAARSRCRHPGEEKLKAAGWDPWRELGLHHRNPIGPLAVTKCSAALPPPKGLSKRGQAALEVDETVWRTGSSQAGALGDIVSRSS